MRIDKRWLLVPPVLGLLLVMGPLRPGEQAAGGAGEERGRRIVAPPASALQVLSKSETAQTAEPPATTDAGKPPVAIGGSAPELPGLLELGVTLAGVLGLGALGLYALARLRGKQGLGADGPARIRQTLRLTAKSTLHVVEFDGRTILVGAGEQGVTLLADAAQAHDDEAALAERDDGVALRDMMIPRPAARPRSAPAPTRSRAEAFRDALEAAGSQR